ncbi:hypothetical protein NQ176_g9105 [Zarea fungicola]|uniref:Uncharacterized protein n=1 Tax=Zarea fungicola TaxID=93591 RepID=A0ACC1MQP0_9HYPO|nr:hypothetical protein NQ176_g9105 [Lecanicillium fungicola]
MASRNEYFIIVAIVHLHYQLAVTLNMFFLISSLLLFGEALASPLLVPRQATQQPFPPPKLPNEFSIAAFGDSFSAGIGAGHFLTASPDGRDNLCARMTGSYPAQLISEMASVTKGTPSLDFKSCSGDVLDDIDGQVFALGKKVDVALVSISGNDFNFANVVKTCVYAKKDSENGISTQQDAQKACDSNLSKASNSIGDNKNFDKFRTKIQLINKQLNPGGVIYITGYPKFFSPTAAPGDQCDKTTFFNSILVRAKVGILPMLIQNRQKMNILVDQVNARIKDAVVKRLKPEIPNIVFIDIDQAYTGHRFCEPGKDPWGSTDDRVFINDLFTIQQETGKWDGDTGDTDANDVWTPPLNELANAANPNQQNNAAHPNQQNNAAHPNQQNNAANPDIHTQELGIIFAGRGPTDIFQQHTVFHPKAVAHQITAALIADDLKTRFEIFSS